MKPVCERHDPDLLMLIHGGLQGAPALRLRAHLLVCPACRARLSKLRSLTGSLALALANPRLGARTFRPTPRTAWLSVGLVVVALSLLGWRHAADASTPATAPAVSTHHACFKPFATPPKAPCVPEQSTNH